MHSGWHKELFAMGKVLSAIVNVDDSLKHTLHGDPIMRKSRKWLVKDDNAVFCQPLKLKYICSGTIVRDHLPGRTIMQLHRIPCSTAIP